MSRAVRIEAFDRRALLSIAAAISVLVTGCGSGVSRGPVNGNGDGPGVDVALRSSGNLGNFLVAGNGRTLYYFGLDRPADATHEAVSNCAANDCLPLWPIFHVASPVLGAGLNAADFGEFVRSDGV